ncbi:HD-GYP domain-containing protein [Candidatus Dependentiae bacterium]|nr:HD-GYP domain-containing protein [Candidatus Dependentiae bacterium]
MLEINVTDLVEGITFNKPLFDDKGSRIASPNSPLTIEEINLLKKWGIQKVKTEGRITSGHTVTPKVETPQTSAETSAAEDENLLDIGIAKKTKLVSLYDDWMMSTCQILKDLSSGTKVDKNSILNIADRIVMVVPQNKSLFLSIVQERETEEYVYGHSLNMAIISVIIGEALKYNNANLRLLGISALLCDIGMLKIPKHIREKQIALAPSDIQLIKTHPIHSNKIIVNYGQFPETVAEVALQLHENYDGSGYPLGKKGDEIHEYAKIISIADSFDAMTKKRSFRKEKVPHTVMKELLKMVEKKFDPRIMKIFLMHMAIYPVGTMTQLDSKELGLVVAVNDSAPLKPIIKILYDSNLKRLSESEIKIIDLSKNDDKKIVGVINPKELGISVVNEL